MSDKVCTACEEKVREFLYRRRCVSCKFARVEIVPPPEDPYGADTYCGNEDSPAYDRTVSFFGNDTCGHFEAGTPEHETRESRSPTPSGGDQ